MKGKLEGNLTLLLKYFQMPILTLSSSSPPLQLLSAFWCSQLLFVRHQFKIAFFSELKQDTQNALK